MIVVAFILGLVFGSTLGILTAAMLVAAKHGSLGDRWSAESGEWVPYEGEVDVIPLGDDRSSGKWSVN